MTSRAIEARLARWVAGVNPRDATAKELAALGAALDTLVAPVPEAADIPEPLRSLQGSAVITPEETMALLRVRLPRPAYRKVILLLSMLASAKGTWLLSGGKYARPFPDLEVADRVKLVAGLQKSSIAMHRATFMLFKGIAAFFIYANASGRLPAELTTLLGYPGVDPTRPASLPDDAVPSFRFVDLPRDRKPDDPPVTLKYDAVIVGSGAGGGVAAALLAQAGHRVLVLEKGTWVHPKDLPLPEYHAITDLYDRSGFMAPDDASIAILAGSTVGGGTTVNWAASLRPQHWLRKEWAKEHGLTYFESEAYQHALDAVCERLGVGTDAIEHNRLNGVLVEGCKKLGMHVADIPQNTRNQPHQCGQCGFGCGRAVKQSSALTWIADATRNGTQILQSCHAQRVLRTHDGRHTRGIAAVVGPDKVPVIIEAPTVVVAGGSIQTPALLLRSGIRNAHLGRHLGLHPVAFALGYYPEPTHPFEGSMMTAVSNVVEDRDGKFYGAKIEATTLHPMIHAYVSQWPGDPAASKRQLAQFDHAVGLLVLARDRDRSGTRINIDEDGQPDIEFALSQFDGASIADGLVAATKVLVSTGAHTVVTGQTDVPALHVPSTDVSHPETVAFCDAIRSVGVQKLRTALFSAHQMGTARMSIAPHRGVTNPRGQVWEVDGLYVADASLFPTSSGVNPMITTYSVAYSVSKWIVEDLAKKNESNELPTAKL